MTGRFFAFGKIPAIGDFFRLGAPQGFVAAWDDWVQSAMLAGQGALGDAWDNHYMSAPIWRFSLPAGLAGADRVMGVLMPSVDRVGRRFPLTLMAPLAGGGGAVVEDHFAQDPLFETLEDLALSALDDDMTRDRLDGELAAIVPPPPRDRAAMVQNFGRAMTVTAHEPGGLRAGLAAAFVGGAIRQPSLWTARIGEASRLMICDGLPGPIETTALFDMNAALWQEVAA